MDNEEIDRRMREPNELTLTERVKRLEDILCLEKVIGSDESILGSVKEEPAWSARGQYVGPRTAYDEIGSRERFAEREKEQAWRNERASAALRSGEALEGIGRRSYADVGAQAGMAAPAQTSFEEIMNRVQHCTDRVIGTAQRLEVIGTRVFGPLPEDVWSTAEATKVNPDGTLDHTLLALNWLDGAIRRLEIAEARISGI